MTTLSNIITPSNVLTTTNTATVTNKTLTAPTVTGMVVSDGTANGVTYLNGSKVLTSGSALVFDGTNLGIGVSPASILHLKGADPIQYFEDSSGTASFCSIQNANGVLDLQADNNATVASSAVKFSVDGSEGMRLTSTGLGIGTSSPAEKLHISNGASTCQIRIAGQSRNMYLGQDATGAIIYSDGAAPMVFYTNATERARIDSSGRLFVGVTTTTFSSSERLEVNGSVGFVTGTGNTNLYCANSGTGSQTYVAFYVGTTGTNTGNITTNGTTTTYATTSDYRLKDNVIPMTGALAKVAQLKPVNYKWKADGSDGQGFIAHELQAVVPDCVTGEKDAINEDGKPRYQGVDTSFLVATLTAALQELNAKFDAYVASHP